MINRNSGQDKLQLLLLDLGAICISFFLAIWVRFGLSFDNWFKEIYGPMLVLLLISHICVFFIFGSDSEFFRRGFFEELFHVIQSNVLMALFISAILFCFKIGDIYSRIFFVSFFLANIGVCYIARLYFKILMLAYFKKSKMSRKIMVVTTVDEASDIIDNMRRQKEWAFQVTSLAILDVDMIGKSICDIPVVANWNNIYEVVTRNVVDEVFINVSNNRAFKLNDIILQFESIGIVVNLSVSTFNLNIHEKTVQNFGGYNVLTFSTRVYDKSSMVIKRVVDILGAIVGLIITFVISLFIVPAILVESPGPVIFSQVRIGQNGRRFKIYKFRSMYKDAEKRKKELLAQNEMQGLMFKITKDPRITRVGAFIRKTSIDELPQFINVLKGDMSLVGTRPPTEDEFLQYEGRHKRRLALKPGITGLWQVSGRSDIEDFEDVVRLDLQYIDNWSLGLDIKLLLKTVGVVVFGVGAK